ncbi:hypothetical protein VXN63_06655 [Marinilactibacillus sp. XAAS-LB27]|uniref:hypothetical protein n=1 Tax=Marinilactibacillus sp. XAAS-LB27 TaxID=3114538 RepID=UPI002E184A13|nr:hypothetical protein [Marinilactibacillus sp. XAAS-LB27]
MKIKLLFSSLSFVVFLTVGGCSDTNGEVDDTENTKQASETSLSFVSLDPSDIKPPELTIHAGDAVIEPILGTYSWSIENGQGIEADSDSPPELVKLSQPTSIDARTPLELDFEEQPTHYSIKIWKEDGTVESVRDGDISSIEGEFVFEILAQWDEGSASYAFLLDLN